MLRHASSGENARRLFGRGAAKPGEASKDVNQSRRLLSLAAVRDGMDRGAAARIGGMDRQTLRDWVDRFNAAGPEGLFDHWTEGPKPRLSPEQLAEFAAIVETVAQPRGRRRRALAAHRSQARHRREVRRRLSSSAISESCSRSSASRTSARDRATPRRTSGSSRRLKKLPARAERSSRRACRRRRRSKSGFRTRPASARRTASCGNGPGVERGLASQPTSATTTPICSARSARRAGSARRWRCPTPTPT